MSADEGVAGVNDCDSKCNRGSNKELGNSLTCIFAFGVSIYLQ